jgi:hypothetical protein
VGNKRFEQPRHPGKKADRAPLNRSGKPTGYVLGQATGVTVDSRNQVFVFHRGGCEWTDPISD